MNILRLFFICLFLGNFVLAGDGFGKTHPHESQKLTVRLVFFGLPSNIVSGNAVPYLDLATLQEISVREYIESIEKAFGALFYTEPNVPLTIKLLKRTDTEIEKTSSKCLGEFPDEYSGKNYTFFYCIFDNANHGTLRRLFSDPNSFSTYEEWNNELNQAKKAFLEQLGAITKGPCLPPRFFIPTPNQLDQTKKATLTTLRADERNKLYALEAYIKERGYSFGEIFKGIVRDTMYHYLLQSDFDFLQKREALVSHFYPEQKTELLKTLQIADDLLSKFALWKDLLQSYRENTKISFTEDLNRPLFGACMQAWEQGLKSNSLLAEILAPPYQNLKNFYTLFLIDGMLEKVSSPSEKILKSSLEKLEHMLHQCSINSQNFFPVIDEAHILIRPDSYVPNALSLKETIEAMLKEIEPRKQNLTCNIEAI